MADIFDEQIREALGYAQTLKLAGEYDLSEKMCRKIVKKIAVYNGTDLIELFYGRNAYDQIRDAADAAKFIFICHCARNAYDMIACRESANSSVSAWATPDKSSNRHMREFFEWLSRRDRRVEEYDCNHFKSLLLALDSYDVIRFKMTDRVKGLSLKEVISGLVNGYLSITSEGELR